MTLVNIGKSIEMDVDFAAMPQAARDHIMYIGARNVLMDCHASITRESNPNDFIESARALAEKKLAALMAGEVRVQSTREGDPVRAEAIRMATDTIRAAIRKSGKKFSDFDPKAVREKAIGMVTPELLAKAKARVDENRAVGADVDLTDLV